ncbi:MAG: hypothetical protein KDB13_04845 [Microthrixaceae bacterium]|nr:hypothetical protein [Microthrixaceae bacterium]
MRSDDSVPAHGSLSSFDDYPVHQGAETIRHALTSDRNFYDRYYFNCHSNDGEAFLIFGLGQYPNLAVTDAFGVLVTGSTHRVVRASKELVDRMDTSVGPLSVEVVKPLQELIIRCEPRDETEAAHGLSFELHWRGSVPAYEEPRQFQRIHGRPLFDTMRLAQTGRWEGWIDLDGRRFEVTPEQWWGTRDRSWGVRPVGDPEPPGIQTDGAMQGFWNYAPMQFEDHSILYMVNEHEDGERVIEEAVRIHNDPDRAPESLGRPEHAAVVTPGTRRIESSVLSFPDAPGGSFDVEVQPLLDTWLLLGTGYGLEEDWRFGKYHGPDLVVQGVDIDYERDAERLFGLVDQVGRFTQRGGPFDGAVGHGLHEFFFVGGFAPYGLEGWDPAVAAQHG